MVAGASVIKIGVFSPPKFNIGFCHVASVRVGGEDEVNLSVVENPIDVGVVAKTI